MSFRGPLLCMALCGGLVGAAPPARSFELGRAVEPPPAVYASGPSRTGRTRELILPSVEAVDDLCRLALGGLPEGAPRGAYYWGCYDAQRDAVVLPDPKAWPDRNEWRLAREHEWAHARGWRHRPDGTGTDWAHSLPPAGAKLAAAAPAP